MIEDGRGETMTLPAGGAAAPHRAWAIANWTTVDLGTHQFGNTRAPEETVAAGSWGSGDHQLGLNGGVDQARIGPSAFDVAPDGSVVVLDQINRRLAVYRPNPVIAPPPAESPEYLVTYIPVPFIGGEGDIAVGDATTYVLDQGDVVLPVDEFPVLGPIEPARPTLLEITSGRVVSVSPLASPRADMIRVGPYGPLVHGYPSEQWLPAPTGALPLTPRQQLTLARPGRPVEGGELIVRSSPTELRLAVVIGSKAINAWRIPSATRLGSIPLAEPMDDGSLLVVVNVSTDAQSEFRVMQLTRSGVGESFTVPRAGWADMAALSRFRVSGTNLYQMQSDAVGARVVRFGWPSSGSLRIGG